MRRSYKLATGALTALAGLAGCQTANVNREDMRYLSSSQVSTLASVKNIEKDKPLSFDSSEEFSPATYEQAKDVATRYGQVLDRKGHFKVYFLDRNSQRLVKRDLDLSNLAFSADEIIEMESALSPSSRTTSLTVGSADQPTMFSGTNKNRFQKSDVAGVDYLSRSGPAYFAIGAKVDTCYNKKLNETSNGEVKVSFGTPEYLAGKTRGDWAGMLMTGAIAGVASAVPPQPAFGVGYLAGAGIDAIGSFGEGHYLKITPGSMFTDNSFYISPPSLSDKERRVISVLDKASRLGVENFVMVNNEAGTGVVYANINRNSVPTYDPTTNSLVYQSTVEGANAIATFVAGAAKVIGPAFVIREFFNDSFSQDQSSSSNNNNSNNGGNNGNTSNPGNNGGNGGNGGSSSGLSGSSNSSVGGTPAQGISGGSSSSSGGSP